MNNINIFGIIYVKMFTMMEYLVTFFVYAIRNSWVLSVVFFIVSFFGLMIYEFKYKKNRTGRKVFFWPILFRSFSFCIIFFTFDMMIGLFAAKRVNEAIEKYGIETDAVFYNSEDSGIVINYNRVDRYRVVFKTNEGVYVKTSVLEYEMNSFVDIGKKVKIKYLRLAPEIFTVIPKK